MRRIESSQDVIVARPKRSIQAAIVESYGPLGDNPNWGDAYDEEVIVHEGEMFGPHISSWVVQTDRLRTDTVDDALPFPLVTERAAPGKISDMVGPASPGSQIHRVAKSTGPVV